ncbi:MULTISPECIES: YhdT family protein [unclassified Fusobacterium]|uniref:YhdT family protein n=1 Tax=unclassified Fusobacterium TaxID=2648384 RepID=UPI0025BDE417|nr:YhdT family protein [Fusobacterium sp.]
MRKKQINREVIATLILYIFYFCWWYYFAYIRFDSENVENFKYIFGLPEWFFYSCVLGLVIINILVFLTVKFFFKDVELEEDKKC